MKQEVTSLICVICLSVAYCCVFPKYLQGTTWHKNIRRSTRMAIYFRENIMEYQQENTELNYITDEWEDRCYQMNDVNKYILIHENQTYSCIMFIKRSESVIQLKYSSISEQISSSLCEDRLLKLDTWPLVSFEKSKKEFQTCPFSGGYNMKIKDNTGTDHPCNFMDLPMRFESECHKGEGITIDFRTNHCIGDLPMSQREQALCVTSWRQDGDVLTILRTLDSGKFWCLRIPARRIFDGKTIMILYVDLTCSGEKDSLYYNLELELVSQNSLCLDEHNGCNRLPCTDYFTSQCLRSCGQCDPNVYPTSCDYPRKIRGEWFLNDAFGQSTVNVSGSRLTYERVGTFSCVTFPDSPPSRKTKRFTTVSFFNNGCRPRYTCAAFQRISSNVYGFALSQSKIWPLPTGHENIWSDICNTDNFYGDPEPVGDTFRTFNNAFKPMVTKSKPVTEIQCPLDASYLFNATFQTGGTCAGRLFKICQEQSHIQLQYENCPFTEHQFQDFNCIGVIDSKYWERIILLQNRLHFQNTSCLILSDVEPGRVILLPSGECDQFTWTYVNVGIRNATVDMIVTPEIQTCRNVETTTPAVDLHKPKTTAQARFKPLQDAYISERYSKTHETDINKSAKSTHKHRHQNHQTTSPSSVYKVAQNDHSDKAMNTFVSSSSTIYLNLIIYIICMVSNIFTTISLAN
ncbi:uncharacterized protein LOC128555676 [Mercenaria mercenaria]|uniref:uncharacterized protein LOC128555676 n=1 Tax=Mercenaria mercenaria TaxID=6596 RepID=UPI00234F7222|nr:uncharacterized protein LOC128555676 [Mercenaria mercenaria]